jgi:hypothetical protein
VPTFVFGLPLHALVVHAVVVLVPMAVLGAVLIAVWPAARRRYRWPVLALTALATVSIPIATSTGEGLEHSLPRSPLIQAHAHLGDQLLPFAAALLVVVAVLAFADRYSAPVDEGTPGPSGAGAARGGVAVAERTQTWARPVTLVLAVLAVVLAAVTAVQVVRIGDAGARAAWSDTQYVQQTPGDPTGE